MSTDAPTTDSLCMYLAGVCESFVEGARTAVSVLTNAQVSIAGFDVEALSPDNWPEALQERSVVQCTTATQGVEIVQWFQGDAAAAIAALAEGVVAGEADLDDGTLLHQMEDVAAVVVEALVKSLAQRDGVSLLAGETRAERVALNAESGGAICGPAGSPAIVLQLEISGQGSAQSWLIVPRGIVDQVTSADVGSAAEQPSVEPDGATPSRPAGVSHEQLARVLNIRVPVVVTLARKKMRVAEVLKLGTGAIIEFDKSYTEPLELGVGNQHLGTGEAIRVGDRFGLKVSEIGPMEERIRSLGGG